jgi:MerR family transcriptional regulator, copper efflux regulator
MGRITTSVLASEAGVNAQSIRFYERLALLPKPARTASGYRVYSTDSVRRVRFIKRAQELGFTLKEIKELLALRIHAPTSVDGLTRSDATLNRRLEACAG